MVKASNQGELRVRADKDRDRTMMVGERELLIRDCYRTPRRLFAMLDKRWGFAVDCAARELDHLCGDRLGPDHPEIIRRDALKCPVELWSPAGLPAYLNPPYSQRGGTLLAFVECAASVGQWLAPVVVVVPATPSTRWFKRAYDTAARIEFTLDRIPYDLPDGTPTTQARGDTAVITWLPRTRGPAPRYLDVDEMAR